MVLNLTSLHTLVWKVPFSKQENNLKNGSLRIAQALDGGVARDELSIELITTELKLLLCFHTKKDLPLMWVEHGGAPLLWWHQSRNACSGFHQERLRCTQKQREFQRPSPSTMGQILFLIGPYRGKITQVDIPLFSYVRTELNMLPNDRALETTFAII